VGVARLQTKVRNELFAALYIPPEARRAMIVDHACGLHKCVDDDRADKFEAAFLELLRHFNREGCLRCNRAFVMDRLAAHDAPEKRLEIFAGLLHLDVDACRLDGGFNLGSRANDSGILEQSLDVGLTEAGDLGRVKSPEGLAECIALAQDGDPGQTGLKSFEHEQFPECAAVAFGHSPLDVMILAEERVALCPFAARFGGFCVHRINGKQRPSSAPSFKHRAAPSILPIQR